MKKIKLLLSLIILIIAGGIAAFGYIQGWFNFNKKQTTEDKVVVADKLQIHFLELGNEYTGDCTYIKAGDVDILIDAGSRKGSAKTIAEYVKKFCTDGKLEYVIATHAHQDHIAGFVGSTSASAKPEDKGIFRQFEVGTLIDFSLTDATSQLYTDYLGEVEYAVSQGAVHKQAHEYFENGVSNVITLSDGITMTILWNKYYFEKSSDENNYSVCTLFTAGNNNFLLTGDLEKEGEEAIAHHYDGSTKELTLPKCKLFKAGHHGSPSSSNDCLLEKIQPEICCVCCCAGSPEYTNNSDNMFPSQEFVNRIAKYTDQVYVTSMLAYDAEEDDWTVKSMNGNIVLICQDGNVTMEASKNMTKLKDTDWFNEEIWYKLVDGNKIVANKKGSTDFYNESTSGAIKGPRRTWPGKE